METSAPDSAGAADIGRHMLFLRLLDCEVVLKRKARCAFYLIQHRQTQLQGIYAYQKIFGDQNWPSIRLRIIRLDLMESE